MTPKEEYEERKRQRKQGKMDQAERYAARQRREDEADAFAEFMMRSIRAFFEGKAELVIDIEDDKFRFVRFVKDGD